MSNEMNEAYRKSIIILSEIMAPPPKVPNSPGSHLAKNKAFATDKTQAGKLARVNFARQMRQSALDHTDPTEGPSLHEDYLRMAELMLEKGILKNIGKAVRTGVAGGAVALGGCVGPNCAVEQPEAEVQHRGEEAVQAMQRERGVQNPSVPYTKSGKKARQRSQETPAETAMRKNAKRNARKAAGKLDKSHTDAPEGPSLHETYGRLVSIVMEASSKRAKRKRREVVKSDRVKRK